MLGQEAHCHLTVHVIGIGHGEARVIGQCPPGGKDSVHGPERESLLGKGHIDPFGPALVDVIADGRAGLGMKHQDHPAEAGGNGVADQQVDDRFPARSDRCQRLATSVPAG